MNKYYSLSNILKRRAQYNIIFGERSNGKTYACLKYGIEQYVKNGGQMAYVRRSREDFIGKRGATMFDSLTANGEIKRITHGDWTDIYYFSSRWFLCRYDEKGNRITDEKPFCFGFALSTGEHDKSTSYPLVTTIIFDEFIARQYLRDEFVLLANVISTIIRQRTNVIIFMLGNTVNKYACPYVNEMGLTHFRAMQPGDIDVYKYGDSELTVAVEYCKPNKQGKPNNFYFAFDNPKLSMITSGEWEMEIYPHLPYKYKPKDVILHYFIEYNDIRLHAEIVLLPDCTFTYIHPKTTDISETENKNVLIFSDVISPLPNHFRRINEPRNMICKKVYEYFITDRVFYSSNEVGEIVRNYLMWCDV